MVKIKTALAGSFGTEISTGMGPVSFDGQGVAEVAQEVADYLKSNFPDVYYDAEGERPTPRSGTYTNPANDKSVQDFARSHTAAKNAEANGTPAVVVESTSKAGPKASLILGEEKTATTALLDENGNAIRPEIKSTDINQDGLVDEKDLSAVHTEYSKEEKEREALEAATPLDEETVAMLEKLNVEDIHATLVAAGVQDKKTEKITDKTTLIPIAAKKLT